eukprot:72967_1
MSRTLQALSAFALASIAASEYAFINLEDSAPGECLEKFNVSELPYGTFEPIKSHTTPKIETVNGLPELHFGLTINPTYIQHIRHGKTENGTSLVLLSFNKDGTADYEGALNTTQAYTYTGGNRTEG